MSAWKPCDIRGPYPEQVNADLVCFAANVIASSLPERARVLLAGDYRTSTPELREAAIDGATRGGVDVIDAGQTPTPIAYFGHRCWNTDAILVVTASHNPPSHNGLKFMIGYLPPTPEEVSRLKSGQWLTRGAPGRVTKRNPVPDYRTWILDRWRHLRKGMALSVVLDAGNGAWSEIAPVVFENLGFHIHPLFCSIDGRFPHRIPDSARPEALTAARRHVVSTGADLGIVWDGDGDRVAFIDSAGEAVTADEVSLLLIQKLLLHKSGQKVVYDVKLSDKIRRCIEEIGCHALIERSGHTFLKRRMILDDCLFGCEASGHYFYRELNGGDDGLYTALMMSDIVQRRGALADLRAALPRIYATPDIRIPRGAEPFTDIRCRVRDVLQPDEEQTIDGIRVRNKYGFVLVRESVTEAVLTLRVEGVDEPSVNVLVKACQTIFPQVKQLLTPMTAGGEEVTC